MRAGCRASVRNSSGWGGWTSQLLLRKEEGCWPSRSRSRHGAGIDERDDAPGWLGPWTLVATGALPLEAGALLDPENPMREDTFINFEEVARPLT